MSSDFNAGVAFFLDCVVNMFVLASVLLGAFDFPRDILFGRIIPGAIVGIFVGNLVIFFYTRRVVQQTGNVKHTSIPLGLDLPSVFGMAFFIIGPVYQANLEVLGSVAAGEKAWVIGMASTFWVAIFKLGFSFIGRLMERELPRMALIGAMACIAIVWLGAEAMLGTLALPEIGAVAFVIMVYTLIAGHKLPFVMPGAILAIIVGTVLYYILAATGAGGGYYLKEVPDLVAAVPQPTLLGIFDMFGEALNYLGILIPFALLIAASAVNIVAGARVVGDQYDPAKVVQMDAGVTALSALFGGVVQTTAYFGHATYKRMGARTGYGLGAAVVIGVGGVFGIIALASELIPEPVLKPILMVVASDILRLAFTAGDVRHAPALLFSVIPAIFNYTFTKVSDLYGRMGTVAQDALSADWMQGYLLLGALSRGYILTSLVWGALIVWIIDRKLYRAAGAALAGAVFTAFGMIHSVLPSAGMYLPWDMPDLGGGEALAYRLAIGYAIAAFLLFAFSFTKPDLLEDAQSK